MAPEMSATHPDIYVDTPIMPDVIADNIVRELSHYLYTQNSEWFLIPSAYDELSEKLAYRANQLYKHNAKWRAKVQRDAMYGRDYLYCFMRHWLAGELINTPVFKLIPESFKNGVQI